MDKIHLEQVETVYRLAPRAIVSSSIVALIVSFVYWDVLPTSFMSVWLAAYTVLTLFRVAVIIWFFKKRIRDRYAEFWFCAGALLASIAWSVLVLRFDSAWGAEYQVLLFLAAWGVIANTSIYSALFSAMITYCLPILLTSFFVLVIQNNEVYYFSAAIVIVLGVGLIFQGYRLSNMTADVVKAQQNAISAYKQLEALSEVDSLTQLKNRGALDSFVEGAWVQAERDQLPICIVMIDVDYFKPYNDHYGHVAGDTCLVKIADIIQRDISEKTGFVGRFGGEEFIIVLLGKSLDEARKIALKANVGVYDENIPHVKSLAADRVTISAGISSLVPTDQNIDSWLDLLDRADANLYIAKKKGRNKIVC